HLRVFCRDKFDLSAKRHIFVGMIVFLIKGK
ncbi:MAG: hypothetical protein ACJA13_002071, partial [Paraglaciecola sp.]